jgi:hypothetical protein
VWRNRWCGVSAVSCRVVELGHEFAVGCAGCGEVFVAFVESQSQVDDLLFEVGDGLIERVNVGRGAEPGLPPGLLAECFGEAFLELLNSCGDTDGPFVRGEQVGLQRGSGDCRPGLPADGWGGFDRVDLGEQVAVPGVEPTSRTS